MRANRSTCRWLRSNNSKLEAPGAQRWYGPVHHRDNTIGNGCPARGTRYLPSSIIAAQPPEPWIKLRAEAVARFKYPARGLTHKCPGHPNKGPLYMALHTLQSLPLDLDPALRTHLQEHFWVHAMLYPRQDPTAAPSYLQFPYGAGS